MILLALLAAAQAAAAQPGELRTFRDWVVGCDNGGTCHAVAMIEGTETDGPGRQLWMNVRRGAGPSGIPQISIDGDPLPVPVFEVEGRPLPVRLRSVRGSLQVEAADLPALLPAFRTAAALQVTDGRGTAIGTISLAGATAALRYMDSTQGRTGTETALIDRGARPASSVRAARPLPQVRAVARGQEAPWQPDSARLAAMRRQAGCEVEEGEESEEPSAYSLGPGRTLILIGCGNGAYNFSTVPFVARRRGRSVVVEPARVERPEFRTGSGHALLYGAGFDEEPELLTTSYLGRGIGDCGSRSHYVWDGSSFRLVLRQEMSECRGSADFITTWRARVVED